MIWLALMTALVVLLLFWILWTALADLAARLQEIGGPSTSSPSSVLAKIRWGVRAIERQTDGLVPQMRQLNETVALLEDELSRAPPGNLGRAI